VLVALYFGSIALSLLYYRYGGNGVLPADLPRFEMIAQTLFLFPALFSITIISISKDRRLGIALLICTVLLWAVIHTSFLPWSSTGWNFD
jgi:hypothetical protein